MRVVLRVETPVETGRGLWRGLWARGGAWNGGRSGIRTLEGREPLPVFRTTIAFVTKLDACLWSGLCLHHGDSTL